MVEVATSLEEWKPVLGFEDGYEVSNQGRVRGVERAALIGNGSYRKIPSSLKSPVPTAQKGYSAVHLYRDNKRSVRYIHSMVLEAFVGPRPDGLEACHGPLGHLVNTPGNLRWGTRSENVQDILRHGNHKQANQTRCKRGHLLSGGNLYINPTSKGRTCRECGRVRVAAKKLQNA